MHYFVMRHFRTMKPFPCHVTSCCNGRVISGLYSSQISSAKAQPCAQDPRTQHNSVAQSGCSIRSWKKLVMTIKYNCYRLKENLVGF